MTELHHGALSIGPARPDADDARALIAELDAFLNALYDPDANHLLDESALLAPCVTFLLARYAGEAVGRGTFRRMDGYSELKRMYVRPLARGRGVGRALIEVLERLMRAEGIRLARLETGVHSHDAVGLYRRMGYRPIGAYGDYEAIPQSLFFEKRLDGSIG